MQPNSKKHGTVDETFVEYTCPITKATLQEPCEVRTCNYHIYQILKLGFNPSSPTNCLQVDFRRNYDDSLDFAVKESGRVGFRDLEYLSLYFKSSVDDLKEIYDKGYEQTRRIMLIQYYSMEIDTDRMCRICGRRKCRSFKCEEVNVEISKLIKDIKPILLTIMAEEQIYACVWYDYRNQKQLFNEEQYKIMQGLEHV